MRDRGVKCVHMYIHAYACTHTYLHMYAYIHAYVRVSCTCYHSFTFTFTQYICMFFSVSVVVSAVFGEYFFLL